MVDELPANTYSLTMAYAMAVGGAPELSKEVIYGEGQLRELLFIGNQTKISQT